MSGVPPGGPVVRARRRVDRPDVRLVGAPAGVGLGLEDVGQALVAEAVDLATPGTRAGGRPRRAARARAPRRLAGTSSPADVASQPDSAWSDAPSRSAASVSAIASRTSVPSVRPRAASTVAPAVRAGLVGGAGPEGERRRDSSRPGIGDDDDPQPVGELRAERVREVVRARMARDGPLGDELGAAHAARRLRRAARRVGRLRDVGQDHAVVGAEHLAGGVADLLGRHRQVARQQRVDQARVVEQRRVHREAVGALLDARERAQLVGLRERLGAGQLVVARQLRREPVELLEIGRLDGGDVDPRPDRRPADADRRAADERQGEDRDVLGEALLADEPPVEPAALAAGQQLAGEVERVEPACRRTPGARNPK